MSGGKEAPENPLEGFTVDGSAPHAAPPSVEKAIGILRSLPYGKLLTVGELADRVGVSYDWLRHQTFRHPQLQPYRVVHRGKNLLGCAKSIGEINRRRRQPES